MSHPPDLVLFLGRLHPLAVHLPVGLILLLAFLEGAARLPKFRHANANAGLILALTVPAAVLTAACGWLLSLGGGYQDRLLQWHKWTGLATAGLCLLAGLLYRLDLKKPYRWCLFSSAAVLLFAGHFGGSLTHGSDYLVRYAPEPFRHWLAPDSDTARAQSPPPAADDPLVFSGLVQPILERHCVSCHGPEKSKAGLRLDSFEAMLKGGDSGPGFEPGKAADAHVLRRARLPLAHEDHMPPEGKPQPSPADLALLEWWIQNGAPTNRTVGQMKPPPAVSRILQDRLGASTPPSREVAPSPLDQVLPIASRLGAELSVVLEAISAAEPWLLCNASLAGTNFGDADLARLAPLGQNLRWLDAGGTAVTDAGLVVLASMPNLTRLHLERTAVTDAGLAHVSALSHLQYLNLHHTAVTDSGIQALQNLGSLNQLFLWGTKVTPEAARTFAEARVDKTQLERWRAEIEQLNAKIRNARFVVDLGAGSCRAFAATADSRPEALAERSPGQLPPDMDFLRRLTADVVAQSRVEPGKKVGGSPTNTCGFTLLMPGGTGGYPAFWIRDFAMSLESGFITPEEIRNHLRLVAQCQNGPVARKLRNGLVIPPFAIPDHINFDGSPVFYPGTYASGEDQGSGAYGVLPPVDDHYEFVHIAYCLFRATGETSFLRENINHMALLERLVAAFNAPDTDARTDLVVTAAARRAVGFGFCDAVYFTGKILFPSLLRYRAAGQLAELFIAAREPDRASAYREIQQRISDNLVTTFSEPARIGGWLLAATEIGRQPDVWGTLYALELEALNGPPANRATATIVEAVRKKTIVFEAGVRHVPTNFDASPVSAWEKTAGVALNTYQNGAYWHTPTGWLIRALRRADAQLASDLFNDYLQHLRRHDFRLGQSGQAPWECFAPKGYVQNGVYMTSVTLPYAALRAKPAPGHSP